MPNAERFTTSKSTTQMEEKPQTTTPSIDANPKKSGYAVCCWNFYKESSYGFSVRDAILSTEEPDNSQ